MVAPMSGRVPALFVAVVAAALLAAGCGTADKVEYERDLAAVGRSVDESLERVPTGTDAQVGPEEVSRIAEDLREAADELDDMDPPEDARSAHERLARGLRGVAKAFDRLADDLGDARDDSAQAELFVRFASDQRVDRAFDDLVEAQEAFARSGYRVFGTGAKDTASKVTK
jgi:outer membrane protein assembly factor BamE (lipoprotein component of BamABCDE complex)